MVKTIQYKIIGGQQYEGIIEFDETICDVWIKFSGKHIQASAQGENYFDTLCQLRTELELYQIRLICNGASLNVYPSGMAKDMGNALMAYVLKEGVHATTDDLVNIFDLDYLIYKESTVEEQKAFFELWNNSKRKRKYSKSEYSVENIKYDSKFLFFWGHQPNKNGEITKSCLSQWWKCSFEKDGVQYSSAEQWMMAEKARAFLDNERLELILNTNDPNEIKKYGRMISNFNEDVWEMKKYSAVKEGNLMKFSQNLELKNFLIETKDAVIVEASPYDTIWGIGMSIDDKNIANPRYWRGKNLLGFALMEVRDILQQVDY